MGSRKERKVYKVMEEEENTYWPREKYSIKCSQAFSIFLFFFPFISRPKNPNSPIDETSDEERERRKSHFGRTSSSPHPSHPNVFQFSLQKRQKIMPNRNLLQHIWSRLTILQNYRPFDMERSTILKELSTSLTLIWLTASKVGRPVLALLSKFPETTSRPVINS